LTKEHRRQFLLTTQTPCRRWRLRQGQGALQKINSASSQVGSALSTAFADAVVEGKNLNDVFSSLIKTLEKAAINSVFLDLQRAGVSGGLSPFASFLASASSARMPKAPTTGGRPDMGR
jgi:hypothetical protein